RARRSSTTVLAGGSTPSAARCSPTSSRKPAASSISSWTSRSAAVSPSSSPPTASWGTWSASPRAATWSAGTTPGGPSPSRPPGARTGTELHTRRRNAMRPNAKWTNLALSCALALGLAACEDDGTGPERTTPDAPADLVGTITGHRILRADTVYTIKGIVTVDSGAVLKIEPGTLILGSTQVTPSALIIRRGGKIIADGRPDAPIVFTSDKPVGQRARGDWGGIVINGRSTCNFPADQCVGEGSSGPYGGNDPEDDSGILRYVRIEFAGY